MPATTAAKAPPLKKFQANTILSEIYRIVGETGDTAKISGLREAICEAVPTTQTMLGRWINNTSQPRLDEACTIAQVLGIELGSLCRTAEAE